jgi:hypothetical protein
VLARKASSCRDAALVIMPVVVPWLLACLLRGGGFGGMVVVWPGLGEGAAQAWL